MMKELHRYVAIGIGILILVVVSAFLFGGRREDRLMAEVSDYIGRIDRYIEDNGRLPASLQDMGIEERLEGPLYYKRQDSAHFVLWFGTTLGESVTYDSRTKSWKRL